MPDKLDDLLEIPRREENKPEDPQAEKTEIVPTDEIEPGKAQAASQSDFTESEPAPDLKPQIKTETQSEPAIRDPFEARQSGPESPSIPEPDSLEITYSPSRVSNYSSLKALASFFKAQAWGAGLGGIASLLYAAFLYAENSRRLGPDFWFFLLFGFGALFTVLPSILISENINLKLDIEANSRQVAKTLERILKSL